MRALWIPLLFALGSPALAQEPSDTRTATFAGGCFWCMEEAYDEVDGVLSATSGYIGGEEANPTYKQVSSAKTGHAEAVEVEYDPQTVDYATLLEAFWHNVDPFAKDRQFCDSGAQYRTAIFYHDEEQKRLAEETKAALEARFDRQIATQIVPAGRFWKAEEYHQNYYEKNPARYHFYKAGCGRTNRLEEIWGDQAGLPGK